MSYRYFFLIFLSACAYQADKTSSSVNRFSDSRYRLIAEWKDRRQTDSLILASREMPAEYKAAAAMALASVQDPKAIPALNELLSAKKADVRLAAAFAMGQMYDTTAYGDLAMALATEKDIEVRQHLLEAIGKTIPEQAIGELLNFTPENQLETAGFSWALYRAGTRGVFNERSTIAAVMILDTAIADNAKLPAAHYVARVNYDELPSQAFEILNKNYENPDVRMAVASGFKRTPILVSSRALKKLLGDSDYRVRINAIRAIPSSRIPLYKSEIDSLLLDTNVNVAIATAEVIVANVFHLDAELLHEWKKLETNWRVSALLLEAILNKDPGNTSVTEEVKKKFLSSRNPYEKAALLNALQNSFVAHEFLVTQTFKATHPAVSTAGIAALAEMRKKEDFPDALKPALREVFQQAIGTGDVAMVDIAAAVLREPTLHYKEEIKDFSFLEKARQKLKLPRDNETLQSLEKTLAFFKNEEQVAIKNTFNNPIKWEQLLDINARQEATIHTARGNIKIELFTEEAPGTVLNFISLAKRGYFNNKVFHRVVPNFVVQGGGNRGDGWGSEDYSIRSEFSKLKYTTGTLGMASAGKDTEGTQWFITHSPTPHLDGRYTIFARVVEGMEFVHKLEQGDKIIKVTIN